MTEAQEDLGGVTRVTRSKLIYHPAYANQVLLIQSGWQQNGEIVWNTGCEIKEIAE